MTAAKKASYAFFASLVLAVVFLDMGPMAMAGLFSYLILDYANRFLKCSLGESYARAWAVVFFLVAASASFWAFQRFLHLALNKAPLILTALLPQMRDSALNWGLPLAAEDLHGLHAVLVETLRDNFRSITLGGALVTRDFFLVGGSVLAALLWFVSPDRGHTGGEEGFLGEVQSEFSARVAGFMDGFEKIFGAQIVTALISAAAMFVFLLAVGLPYFEFLSLATLILGVIPIVGPIMANILIVGSALMISLRLALLSVGFIVILRGAEYVIAGTLWGAKLDLPMWAILLAMLIGDRVMGVSGMILGPAILSFIRAELKSLPAR